jgi:hypothetical protein
MGIILLPIVIYVAFYKKITPKLYKLGLLGMVLAVIGLMIVESLVQHPLFLPLWGKNPETFFSLLTWKRTLDTACFLFPAAIPMFYFVKFKKNSGFYIILSLCAGLFMVIFHPVMRDWDIQATIAPILFFVVIMNLPTDLLRLRFTILTVTFCVCWLSLIYTPNIIGKLKEVILVEEAYTPKDFFISTNENIRKYYSLFGDVNEEIECVYQESLRDSTCPTVYKIARAL